MRILFKKQQNVINMKQKDVITRWLVAFIISCMMLAGCTEKSRKHDKKKWKHDRDWDDDDDDDDDDD